LNSVADQTSLGVKFGKFCIKNDISVTDVATSLGVSRPAVYNWFRGSSKPTGATCEKIERFIAKNK
jgi:predicted transcriptional regulator